MKKVLCLLLSMIVVIMTFQVNILGLEDVTTSRTTETNKFNHERVILEGLGIITEEDIYEENKLLTRGEFSVMIANLIGYDGKGIATGVFYDVEKEYFAADEIEFLYAQGIIKGCDNGEFRAGKTITYQEAISLLLRVMGIDNYAEYYKNSYFPKKKIKGDSEYITFGMALGYIYEALNTEVYEYDPTKGGMAFRQSGKTVLEKWRDISVIEGVVLAIGYRSIIDNGAEDIFMVDNVTLRTNEPYKFDCIGKYSEVYYYNGESSFDGNVIVAEATDKFNNVDIINGEDAYYKDGKIYYLENGKEKSISVSARAYIAKNYKPVYNADPTTLFDINSGRIIVNKIKKNNVEVVMIEDCENYVVSGKSEYEQKIYTMDGKTLNLKNVEELIITDLAGNKLELSDICNEDKGVILNFFLKHTMKCELSQKPLSIAASRTFLPLRKSFAE